MRAKRGRGAEITGERILEAALALFRERGFDEATMRDVAKAAGTSLGAAYYYVPSKEALVLRYYERQLGDFEHAAEAAFSKSDDVRERLEAAVLAHLDVLRADRGLLVALCRVAADPTSELSVFAPETAAIRTRSIAILERAIEPLGLADDARALLASALWIGHLGVVLFYASDSSRGQRRTKKLLRDLLDLVGPLLPLAPALLSPQVVERATAILAEAGLSPGGGRTR